MPGYPRDFKVLMSLLDEMRLLEYTGRMAKTVPPNTKAFVPPAVADMIRYGNDLMAAARNLQDLSPSVSGEAHKHRKMLRERAQKILSVAAASLAELDQPPDAVPV